MTQKERRENHNSRMLPAGRLQNRDGGRRQTRIEEDGPTSQDHRTRFFAQILANTIAAACANIHFQVGILSSRAFL